MTKQENSHYGPCCASWSSYFHSAYVDDCDHNQFKSHDEDQKKVVGHGDCLQVEGERFGERAVPLQYDQRGDGVG